MHGWRAICRPLVSKSLLSIDEVSRLLRDSLSDLDVSRRFEKCLVDSGWDSRRNEQDGVYLKSMEHFGRKF